MGSYRRRGHWRRGRNGQMHWVSGHDVTRGSAHRPTSSQSWSWSTPAHVPNPAPAPAPKPPPKPVTVRFVDAGVLPPGVVFGRRDNLPDGGRVLRRLIVALLIGAASVQLGPAATVLIPVLVLTVWTAMGWVDRWRRGTAGAVAKVVLPPKWHANSARHLDFPSDGAVLGMSACVPPAGGWGFEATVAASLLRRGGTWRSSPVKAHPSLRPSQRVAWAAEASSVLGEAARLQDARGFGRPVMNGTALIERAHDLIRIWDTGVGVERLVPSRHLPSERTVGQWMPGALVATAVVAVIVCVAVIAGRGHDASPVATAPGDVPVAPPAVLAATVTRIVDGDTIDVSVDGVTRRIRLLNVDTPETVEPGVPVQCLGPEATQAISELLPIGTQVELRHDLERRDRYGRELAAVFVGGTMVSEELARQGLGIAVVVGSNDRFYEPVRAAQAEAQAAGRGLFSPGIECTVPAQLAAVEATMLTAAPTAPTEGSSLADVDAFAATVLVVVAQVEALEAVLQAGAVLPLPAVGAATSAELTRRASVVRLWAQGAQANAGAVRLAVEARLASEAEAARRAAEEAEAESRETPRPPPSTGSSSGGSPSGRPSTPAPAPAPDPQPAPPPASSGDSSGGGASSGSGGAYNGCRAYGPNGTSIDDKGRPYTKIDCGTGLPIG